MKFLLIAASHRQASLNKQLIMLARKHIEAAGHETVFAEYQTLDMPTYNDEICTTQDISSIRNHFAELLKGMHGVVVSAPEYNWSYPGSLKNILDWTSCIKPSPLKGKTVFLMCATPSIRGGISGLMHLKLPFEALYADVYTRVFPLSNASTTLSDSGIKISKIHDDFITLLHDYITFTRKLSTP